MAVFKIFAFPIGIGPARGVRKLRTVCRLRKRPKGLLRGIAGYRGGRVGECRYRVMVTSVTSVRATSASISPASALDRR